MDNYRYYMSRSVNNEWEEDTDLESYFNGLRVCTVKGLSSKGKPKNIYTESYAETDELRLYLPENVSRENTGIEITLAFGGDNRRDIYDTFCDWVTGHKIRYRDTCRKREAEMVLLEALELSDDYLYGSEPYLTVDFKFKNINGQTKKIDL